MILSECVERQRNNLSELHACVEGGDIRKLLGLLTITALGEAEQTAALGMAGTTAGCDSDLCVAACLRVDAKRIEEVGKSSLALAATESHARDDAAEAGPVGCGFIVAESDTVTEVEDGECYCFVVNSGPHRGRRMGPGARGSVFQLLQTTPPVSTGTTRTTTGQQRCKWVAACLASL